MAQLFKHPEKTLTKKLTIVLLVKFIVLLAFWLGFVRDQRVPVNADRTAAQLLQPLAISAQGLKP